jgi:UDP-N-acetylmuramoyl-L-alanyl-D-glutamate--2,6-diaminopimelate ligase
MGAAVGASADVIWITSDNPRTEPAAQILDDIRPGLAGARGVVFEEQDRAIAIRSAIVQARPGAVVLVLGKGHETYQLIGSEVLAFDDRVEVSQALRARREARS